MRIVSLKSRYRCPANLDLVAVFCVAVLPDLVRSLFVLTESVQVAGYSFSYLHCALVVRSLQVSLPILLIMHLKNVDWREHGFTPVRLLRDPVTAIGLVAVSYVAYVFAYIVLACFGADFQVGSEAMQGMIREMSPSSIVAIPVMLASSLANGFSEELALRSYFIPRLLQLSGSRTVAVLATSSLFSFYHLYQGPLGAVSVFLVGLVFGTYFVTARRFWPIAVAHAALDVIAQLAFL